jgi:hypothetical protein
VPLAQLELLVHQVQAEQQDQQAQQGVLALRVQRETRGQLELIQRLQVPEEQLARPETMEHLVNQ